MSLVEDYPIVSEFFKTHSLHNRCRLTSYHYLNELIEINCMIQGPLSVQLQVSESHISSDSRMVCGC